MSTDDSLEESSLGPEDYLKEPILKLIYRIGRSQERLSQVKAIPDIQEWGKVSLDKFIATEQKLTDRYVTAMIIRRCELKDLVRKSKPKSGSIAEREALLQMVDMPEHMKDIILAICKGLYITNKEGIDYNFGLGGDPNYEYDENAKTDTCECCGDSHLEEDIIRCSSYGRKMCYFCVSSTNLDTCSDCMDEPKENA